MTQHGGLPFLGIPFQGEEDDSSGSDWSSKEEDQTEPSQHVVQMSEIHVEPQTSKSGDGIDSSNVPASDVRATQTTNQETDSAEATETYEEVSGAAAAKKAKVQLSKAQIKSSDSMTDFSSPGSSAKAAAVKGLGLFLEQAGVTTSSSTLSEHGSVARLKDEIKDESVSVLPQLRPKRVSSLSTSASEPRSAVLGPTSDARSTVHLRRTDSEPRATTTVQIESGSSVQSQPKSSGSQDLPGPANELSAVRSPKAVVPAVLEGKSPRNSTDKNTRSPTTATSPSGETYSINFGPGPELNMPSLSGSPLRRFLSRSKTYSASSQQSDDDEDGPHPGTRVPAMLLPDIPVGSVPIQYVPPQKTAAAASRQTEADGSSRTSSRDRRERSPSPITKQLSQFLPAGSHSRQNSQNKIPRRPVPSGAPSTALSRDLSQVESNRMALRPSLTRSRAVSGDRPRRSGDIGSSDLRALGGGMETSSTSSDRTKSATFSSASLQTLSLSVSNFVASQDTTVKNLGRSVSGEPVASDRPEDPQPFEGKDSRSRNGMSITKDAISRSLALMQGRHQSNVTDPSKKSKIKLPRLSSLGSMLSVSDKVAQERAASVAEAAGSGNVDRLKILLQDNAKVVNTYTTQSDEGLPKTALMRAAIANSPGCLDVLRSYGADFDASDSQGRTLLHLAVEHGAMQSVEWLVALPAKDGSNNDSMIGRSDISGLKPLHVAAAKGFSDMIDILIESGANIEAKDNRERTPLMYALSQGQQQSAIYLIARGCNIETRDIDMETPLITATEANSLKAIKALLEKGAERGSRDVHGNTAIHHGARLGHLTAVEAIYTHLSEFEERNEQGETALHLACSANQVQMVRALIDLGVDVNVFSSPKTATSSAQKSKSKHAKTPDKLGLTDVPSTPLHYACMFAEFDTVAALIQGGGWINAAQEDRGLTPLMLAVENSKLEIAQQLLDTGARINASTATDCLTALHLAAARNDLPMARLLMDRGADTFAKSRIGETPFNYGHHFVNHKDSSSRQAVDFIFGYNVSVVRERQTWEELPASPFVPPPYGSIHPHLASGRWTMQQALSSVPPRPMIPRPQPPSQGEATLDPSTLHEFFQPHDVKPIPSAVPPLSNASQSTPSEKNPIRFRPG